VVCVGGRSLCVLEMEDWAICWRRKIVLSVGGGKSECIGERAS
jgi:hypothetical protein